MKKSILTVAIILGLSTAAHAAMTVNACGLSITHFPTTRAELLEIAETGAAKELVFMNASLLVNLAQQDLEDFCYGEGVVLDDAPTTTEMSCEDTDTFFLKNKHNPMRVYKKGVAGQTVTAYAMRVRALRRLLALPMKRTARFCAVVASTVGRAVLPTTDGGNEESRALMCLPTGPDGTMQTEEVHVDDVAYWQENGGTTGACEGQTTPPQY